MIVVVNIECICKDRKKYRIAEYLSVYNFLDIKIMENAMYILKTLTKFCKQIFLNICQQKIITLACTLLDKFI